MSDPSAAIVRAATVDDVARIFELVQALADYERLSHEVTGNVEQLTEHLFGDRPCIETVLAEVEGESIGFALFFTSYSTFLTKPGIYLEDLFVMPDYRGRGIGKLLLSHLAKLAIDRDCGRLEWSVLDWNEPAIGFYQRIGATVLPDWRTCRVTGRNLQHLAGQAIEGS